MLTSSQLSLSLLSTLGRLDQTVRELLGSLALVLGTPPPELHAYELMSGVRAWAPIAGKTRLKISILSRTLKVVQSIPGAVVFVQGTDVQRLKARYRYPENPHTATFRHLLEQLDNWATNNGTRVGLVADDIVTKNEHQMELPGIQRVWNRRLFLSGNSPRRRPKSVSRQS